MSSHIQLIREKLSLIDKPFVHKYVLQKLLYKFAPGYTIGSLSYKNLISPIKKGGTLYLNLLYNKYVNPYSIGAVYFAGDTYAFGGLQLYNSYGFTTQSAERYTIYNTKISGKKHIGNAKFVCMRARLSFFYGIQTKNIQEQNVHLLSPERALIQLLYQTKGNPEFAEDIYEQLATGKISQEKLLHLFHTSCSTTHQKFINNFLQGYKTYIHS